MYMEITTETIAISNKLLTIFGDGEQYVMRTPHPTEQAEFKGRLGKFGIYAYSDERPYICTKFVLHLGTYSQSPLS